MKKPPLPCPKAVTKHKTFTRNKFFYLQGFAILLFLLSINVCNTFAQTSDWSNAWGFTPLSTGETIAQTIVHDANGNLYVLGGGRDSTNTHYYSTFLIKYDPSGNLIWKRDFTAFGKRTIIAYNLSIDVQNRLYVCGSFEGFPTSDSSTNNTLLADTVVKSAGSYDAFLMQLDSAGHSKWLRVYGGPQGESFRSICVNKGQIIVSGVYDDTIRIGPNIILHEQLNSQRPFIAAFDTDGNPLWAKTLKSTRNIGSLFLDKNKNLYMAGSFGLDLYLDNVHVVSGSSGNVVETGFYAKFDSSGTCIWAKGQNGFGGPTGQGNISLVQTQSILVHPNGQISVAGNYYNCAMRFGNTAFTLPIPDGGFAPFLARCDANGNILWIKGGQSSTAGSANILSDSANNIYITGGMDLPGTFGTDTLSEIGKGKVDAFLFKYSPAGNLIWGRTAGADLEDVGSGITLSLDESSVYMVGTARSNSPMYFGNIPVPLAGNSTMFVGKASNTPLSIPKVIGADFSFSVFPNPATNALNLRLPAGTAVQEAALYNTLGNMIFQWSGLASKAEMSLPLPGVAAGTYTLLVRSSAGGQSFCKVVINL